MKRLLLLGLLLVATVAGPASAVDVRPAELAIEQPHYVDGEVTESRDNGTPIYTVQDGRLKILPQNFGNGDVVGFGVETEGASLSYNEQLEVFEFRTEHTGTFRLYWSVEIDREVTQNNTTTTETVRQRYVAVVRVEENGEYDHVPAGSLEEQRDAAENWSAFAGAVRDIYGKDANLERRTQQAIHLLQLQADPLGALSGQFTSILLTLFITLGGLVVLLLFGVWHVGVRWSDIRYIHREESKKATDQDIEDRLVELKHEERQRMLQNTDWNDLLEDDNLARAMRDVFGETVYDGTCRLQELTLPENLVRDRLGVMGLNGYVGVVERDGDEIVDADLRTELTVDEAETVELTDSPEEFLDALDWSHPDLRSFDLAGAETTHADVDPEDRPDVSLEALDLEELMERLEVQQQDFETPDVWGEYLLEFVEDVRQSEYTDEHGTPDATRYVLNAWLQTAQLERDCFDVPLLEYLGEAIEHALADRDPVASAEQVVSKVEAGKGA